MNRSVFITCAVTGSGDGPSKSEKVPVTPREIADACIEAAAAGAAIAHCHVRDPETGAPSRRIEHYREVIARVREAEIDVILNFTAGTGGDLVIGSPSAPLPFDSAGTDMVGDTERLAHVAELLPEICTLDCGSMNFAQDNYVMINPPAMLRSMARIIRELGVKPEIEVFDAGHLWLARQLVDEGLIDDPVLVQLCVGIPYGIPNDPVSVAAFVNATPKTWTFSLFSVGQMQLPFVAQAALLGGNVRVGLEDNLWLAKGHKATNGALVERAVTILAAMNIGVLSAAETRKRLQLQKRW